MSSGKKKQGDRVTPLFLKSGFVLVVPDDPAGEAGPEEDDATTGESSTVPSSREGNDSP